MAIDRSQQRYRCNCGQNLEYGQISRRSSVAPGGRAVFYRTERGTKVYCTKNNYLVRYVKGKDVCAAAKGKPFAKAKAISGPKSNLDFGRVLGSRRRTSASESRKDIQKRVQVSLIQSALKASNQRKAAEKRQQASLKQKSKERKMIEKRMEREDAKIERQLEKRAQQSRRRAERQEKKRQNFAFQKNVKRLNKLPSNKPLNIQLSQRSQSLNKYRLSILKDLPVVKPNKIIPNPKQYASAMTEPLIVNDVARQVVKQYKLGKYFYCKMHGGEAMTSKPQFVVPKGYIFIFIGMSQHVTYPDRFDKSGWLSARSPKEMEKKINLMASTTIQPETLFGETTDWYTAEQKQTSKYNINYYTEFHTYFPNTLVDNIEMHPDPPFIGTRFRYEQIEQDFLKSDWELQKWIANSQLQLVFDNIQRLPMSYKMFHFYRELDSQQRHLRRYRGQQDFLKKSKILQDAIDRYRQQSVLPEYHKKIKCLHDVTKFCPPGVYIMGNCREGAQNKQDIMADEFRGRVIQTKIFQKYLRGLFTGHPPNKHHPLMKPEQLMHLQKQDKVCRGKSINTVSPDYKYICFPRSNRPTLIPKPRRRVPNLRSGKKRTPTPWTNAPAEENSPDLLFNKLMS